MLAHQLGWELDATTDDIEPIIAANPVRTAEQLIPEGKTTGLLQTGRGFRHGREVIHLLFARASVSPGLSIGFKSKEFPPSTL